MSCLSEIEPNLGVLRDLQELKARSVSAAAQYHKLRAQLEALRSRVAAEKDAIGVQPYALLRAELEQLESRTKTTQQACEDSEREWANAANAEFDRQAKLRRSCRRESLLQELAAHHVKMEAPTCYSYSEEHRRLAQVECSRILAELCSLGPA